MFDNMTLGVLSAGFAVLLILSMISYLYPRPYPGIPYNTASAKTIAGDVPDLMRLVLTSNEFSDNLFTVTTRRLKSPIAQFLFPGFKKPLIIIDDPWEVEDICCRRNSEFDVAPMEVEISGRVFPNSPLSQYTTPELRAHKRRWADTVSHKFIRDSVSRAVYTATLELIELWHLRAKHAMDVPFVALDDLENSTLDASLCFTASEVGGMTRSEIVKLQRQMTGDRTPVERPHGMFIKTELTYLTNTIARNTLTPSPKWAQLLTTYTSRYLQSRRVIKSAVGRAIDAAVHRLDSDGSNEPWQKVKGDPCMLDLILQKQILEAKMAGSALYSHMDKQRLIDETFVMICGGYDSVANTLAWFLKFMESHPLVQTKLREVLQDAFPGPDLPSLQEILDAEIPYLHGACEEAARLGGAAKAQLRQAIVDTQVLGCPIPKGAELFLNLHIDREPAPIEEFKRSRTSQATTAKPQDGIKRSHDLRSFDPERWLVKDDAGGTKKFNPRALPSTAFGGGYRGCFGRKIAELDLRINIVLLILSFEFMGLPEELRTVSAHERIFRHPDTPHVRLRKI